MVAEARDGTLRVAHVTVESGGRDFVGDVSHRGAG